MVGDQKVGLNNDKRLLVEAMTSQFQQTMETIVNEFRQELVEPLGAGPTRHLASWRE